MRSIGYGWGTSTRRPSDKKVPPTPNPSPPRAARVGGRGNRILVLAMRFLIRAPSFEHAVQKTLPHSQPLSDDPGRGEPEPSRSGSGTKAKNERKKRKQNAERRSLSSALARCGARPAGRARLSAFHCGSCQGDCSSPRRNPGQSFLRLGGSLRVLRTANRGESRKPLHGRYPRPPVPVQRAPRAPVIVPAG